jgi:fatty-acyl-CoA synthase
MPAPDRPAADSGRPYDWIGAWSERRARLTPEAVGLRDATTGEAFTYRELDARANRTARLLRDHGVTDGERVAVVSRNRPTLVDLFFATGKTGGVLAPVSHRLAPPEVGTLLDDIDPTLLVVEEAFDDLAESVLERAEVRYDGPVLSLPTSGDHGWPAFHAERPRDDSPVETTAVSLADPHLFLHTGGSTGTPKVTEVTHGSICWNSFNTITAWGLRSDDVSPMVFPMFHTGGWNVLTVPLFHLGAEVVIAREFDPGRVLEQLDGGATVFVAVPAMFRMLTEHDDWEETDLSSLRLAKSGGGPCRETVMRAWWDRGVDLTQGYGLTECGPNNFAMPDDWTRERADSVGVPAMHVDARIVDDEGEPVEPGTIGELELAGLHAASGYWRRDEETGATFGGGWVSTGDLARVDADGYYSIEGRKKNLFVSGGENVYPAEVEDAIADHDAVDEVVVIPVSDEQWGQVGKAVVQGDESLTLDELRSFLDGRLADFKQPRHLAFITEMPMSGPSKIDRETVKERFEGE